MSDKKKKRKASAGNSPAEKPAPAQKAPVEEAAVQTAAAEADPYPEKATKIEHHELFGLMGWFTTPAELYHACETLRDAGYKQFDAHTPFPVHGLEKAMGLPRTKFPLIVFGGGVTGLTGAIALAYYTQAVDYPQNISGKLPFSYQAYIPIFFELTVLLAGLTCFFGLWAWLRLPTFFHPTFQHPSFHRHSDDAFFISVEAKDPKFDREKTREMLENLGVKELQEVRT
ncbi:ABC-type Fe3+ transport system protein [Minicystis rosea]|nr:ABC-type Fe3+ transport system protein [Minicystis rosea]